MPQVAPVWTRLRYEPAAGHKFKQEPPFLVERKLADTKTQTTDGKRRQKGRESSAICLCKSSCCIGRQIDVPPRESAPRPQPSEPTFLTKERGRIGGAKMRSQARTQCATLRQTESACSTSRYDTGDSMVWAVSRSGRPRSRTASRRRGNQIDGPKRCQIRKELDPDATPSPSHSPSRINAKE